MKILKLAAVSSLMICTLAACGGGGGTSGSTPAPPAAKTVVSGIATKGPFLKESVVSVYAVTNGARGALITQTATTDDNGSYSADLGSYTGPVIVEVSGTFHDEATGRNVAVAGSAPIRAAIPMAQGNVTLPVTPLTELAVQKAASLAPDAISAANALVSDLFKVDVVATLPVAPTAAALGNATQAQKDYTLALAAVSQLASQQGGASDSDNLNTAMATLSQGISSAGMSGSASAAFQGALNSFVTSNPNNQTGISDTSTTSIVNAGTISKSYTLTLQGSSAVNGVQFDLTLPEGMTVNYNKMDSTMLASSLVMLAGFPSDLLVSSKYSSGVLTVGMVTMKGLKAGGLARLTCNVTSGMTPPAGSAFTVSNLKVVDDNGNPVTGVSVTVN
jgi:hypothetical protein